MDQPRSSFASNVVVALPPAVQDRTGLQALNNCPSIILHEERADECQGCGGQLYSGYTVSCMYTETIALEP